ncbi:hypothetical protein TCAL_07338 [Tigriopus californicus]|uniref:Major facilitator superfamily associated domain-containing protein n=1 Tax=Tigriopus californicus TaxID=6832 RepID=A0A553NX40_TIGCA|nr:hypothetical protein TCAL_07338 [Tigriopus californicus]
MEVIKPRGQLWPLKLHYFFHGLGGAPILPFLSVIAKQLGMPGSGIGMTMSIIQDESYTYRLRGLNTNPSAEVVSLLSNFPRHKISIFRLLMLGHLLGFFLIQFVPPIETEEMTLEPECVDMNQLGLTVDGEVDPCTINKLHTFYDKTIQCQLSCRSRESPTSSFANFQGTFNGKTSTFPAGKSLRIQFETASCSPDLGKCFANCSDPQLRKVLNKQHDGHKAKTKLNYWILTFLWVFGGITAGGVMTFQDAICHQVLTAHNSKEHYGHQRLFASLGWGMAAFIVGYWVDQDSAQSLLFDYSVAFKVMSIAWLMDILVVGYLEIPNSNVHRPHSPWQALTGSFMNIETLIFLFYCIIVGICFSALPFHFILLEELGSKGSCASIQALKLLQGLCLSLNCTGEIPVFFYSGSLVRRFGAKNIMNSVLLLFCLRFFYYSQMIGPWDTIYIEFFNGWCVALFFPAMTTFATKVAPDGAALTMTALAFAAYEGVGGAIGGTVAGTLYEMHGAPKTFEYFSYFALVGFLVHLILQQVLISRRTPHGYAKSFNSQSQYMIMD